MLEPHDAFADFARPRASIEAKARKDGDFASLVDAYAALDGEVVALEEAGAPVSDAHMETLKKRRLLLKDRIRDGLA